MSTWIFLRGLPREIARYGAMPPYHLLAMSLGAMVAVAWAAS